METLNVIAIKVINNYCMDEAEHVNYQELSLNNSKNHAKSESNNCFFIHLKTSETFNIRLYEVCYFVYFIFACLKVRLVGRARIQARKNPIMIFLNQVRSKKTYYSTLSTSVRNIEN